MERQYSVQFFQGFIENLQKVCQETIFYNQFVEISGYVSVEIDNVKKERYVLSELLQNNGNIVSESFCAKATKTMQQRFDARPPADRKSFDRDRVTVHRTQRCSSKSKRPFSDECSLAPESHLYFQSRLSDKQINRDPPEQFRFKNSDGLSNVKHSRTVGKNADIFDQFNIPRASPLSGMSPNNPNETLPSENTNISLEHDGKTKQACQYVNVGNASKNMCHSFVKTNQQELAVPMQLFKHEENISMITESQSSSNSFNSPALEEVIDLECYPDDHDLDLDKVTYAEQSEGSLPSYIGKKTQLRPGTQMMVNNSVNQFKRFFLEKYNKDIDVLTCLPEHLNNLLLEYFQEAKKVDGGELKARSLKCVQERLILYLKDGDYSYSLTKDPEFASSRDYLKKRLTEEGRVACHIYSAVDDNDIEMLFQTSQLGLDSPESLTNTMWLMNTKYFNVKGPAVHLDLKWGDITLKTTEQGDEYLERPRAFSLKVFASPADPSRCWVNCYKHYQALRPKVALDEGYAFYLKHAKREFLPEPMVYHQLSSLWRKIVFNSRLPVNKKIM